MGVLNFYNSADGNMWREYEGVFSGNGGFNIGKTTVRVYGALRFESINIPQGTTVTSATLKIYIGAKGAGSGSLKHQYWGIDEDNTGTFSSDPLGRSKTTASHSPDTTVTSVGNFQDLDVASEVNEILARGGWSSGNALGFIFNPRDGTPDDLYMYDDNTGTSTNSYLVIDYDAPSASPSASPSESPSISPSPSLSPSASPSPIDFFSGMKIAKPEINVLETQEPYDLIFGSKYGTLKYFLTGNLTFTIDGDLDGNLNSVGTASFAHNLGYIPYFEVYMLNPLGKWEYCPTYNGGASTSWATTAVITSTELKVYASIAGFSQGGVDFDFKYFIYRNNLGLE